MKVGFVGLGQMGAGMAARLIAAGHQVTVWNRDSTKTEALRSRGADVAAHPADAARAGVVLTMLADDDALDAVSSGENGLLAAGPGLLHISCSTVSVALTDRLTAAHGAAGQRFVSAQVLGRPDAAAAGRLTVIAAGPANDLDAAQPCFDAIGSTTIPMGDRPAMAAATKAGAQGVPAAAMAKFLLGSEFGARIFASYAPMIAERRFEPAGFLLRLGRKDIGLAFAAAEGAALPFADLLARRLDTLIDAGGGERDWSSLGLSPTSR